MEESPVVRDDADDGAPVADETTAERSDDLPDEESSELPDEESNAPPGEESSDTGSPRPTQDESEENYGRRITTYFIYGGGELCYGIPAIACLSPGWQSGVFGFGVAFEDTAHGSICRELDFQNEQLVMYKIALTVLCGSGVLGESRRQHMLATLIDEDVIKWVTRPSYISLCLARAHTLRNVSRFIKRWPCAAEDRAEFEYVERRLSLIEALFIHEAEEFIRMVTIHHTLYPLFRQTSSDLNYPNGLWEVRYKRNPSLVGCDALWSELSLDPLSIWTLIPDDAGSFARIGVSMFGNVQLGAHDVENREYGLTQEVDQLSSKRRRVGLRYKEYADVVRMTPVHIRVTLELGKVKPPLPLRKRPRVDSSQSGSESEINN